MELFWRKRLASDEDQAAWMLPFGDLMALLLAVFIMIAAMSEWHTDRRFQAVAGGVRTAFGFGVPAAEAAETPSRERLTLVERLERAGLGVVSQVRLAGVTGREVALCRMVAEREGLRLMLSDDSCFEPFSAALKPAGRQFAAGLAEYLSDGTSRVRVSCAVEGGSLPADAMFRDGWDLAYERVRSVMGLLVEGGVARERLAIEVGTGNETTEEGHGAQGHRGLEIVVEAEPTVRATDKVTIADGA